MTTQPTLLNPNMPSWKQILDDHRREIFKNLNCMKIGVIEAFNPGSATEPPTATVRVAFQQVRDIQPDGTRILAEYPLLVQVPVYMAAGGGFVQTMPVAVGDECMLLFCDRSLDIWKDVGAGQPPNISRMHSLSDAICIVGLWSKPRAFGAVSTTGAQLRSADGATLIDIQNGKISIIADEVVIHGRNKTTFDAGGTGFVYTPSKIDTYTDGVASDHHAPNPPQVPT